MTNALAEAPGIGHNQPPLVDQLAEEVAPFAKRAAALIAVAETAVIVDEASAAKCVDLSRMMQTLEDEIEAARKARKEPFLVAGRTVDGTFNPVIERLAVARSGPEINKRRRGGLGAMLTVFRQRQEADAEAARQVAAAEQSKREEEAEAARQAAEAARGAGKGAVTAELDAIAAEEAAAAAQRRVDAIRPAPIRAALGSVASKREIAFDVTDVRKLLSWMLKQSLKGAVEAAARELMARHLRHMGIEAVERGDAAGIPGIAVRIEAIAAIRR